MTISRLTENWLLGFGLIALTITIHVLGCAIIVHTQRNIWSLFDRHARNYHDALRGFIISITVAGLLLSVFHILEILIWAAVIYFLDALPSFSDSLFYSLDSMTTRGASELIISPHWHIMGALEGVDGMLLFGISTAFLFTIMQVYWQKLVSIYKSP